MPSRERLFEAPFVVVAHGQQADPIFNYANRLALELWEIDLPRLLVTPSRLTAEPVHRQERERLLEQTARQGFVDNYQGIRITASGRRFRIERRSFGMCWILRGSRSARRPRSAPGKFYN